MRQLTVHKNDENQRLDKYLKKYLKEAPGSFIYKMLRKKNIVLNGKKADGTEKLSAGDEIKLFFAEETLQKFTGETIKSDMPQFPVLKNLEILFEDEDILILNKPVGELSQKAEAKDVSMNEYALGYLQQSGAITEESLKVFKPSVCNRLDRNTSGILLCGKSLLGSRELNRLIPRFAFRDSTLTATSHCGSVTSGSDSRLDCHSIPSVSLRYAAQSFAGKTRRLEEFSTRLLLRIPSTHKKTKNTTVWWCFSFLVHLQGFEPGTH